MHWNNTNGKTHKIFPFCTLQNLIRPISLAQLKLKDNPGHINFISLCINNAFPSTFKTLEEIKTALKVVIKRLREKIKRQESRKSSKKEDTKASSVEPTSNNKDGENNDSQRSDDEQY